MSAFAIQPIATLKKSQRVGRSFAIGVSDIKSTFIRKSRALVLPDFIRDLLLIACQVAYPGSQSPNRLLDIAFPDPKSQSRKSREYTSRDYCDRQSPESKGCFRVVGQSIDNFMNKSISTNTHDSIKACNPDPCGIVSGKAGASRRDDVSVVSMIRIVCPTDDTSGSHEEGLDSFSENLFALLASCIGIDIDLESHRGWSYRSDEST